VGQIGALPKAVQAAGSNAITYIHDQAGRLVGVVDSTNAAVYKYDAVGNAQSRLSMGTKPDGYIQVPRPPGAPEPTGVQSNNGQPGGGLEVPVKGPVRLPPGSVFSPF
jgi:hypothetical protein